MRRVPIQSMARLTPLGVGLLLLLYVLSYGVLSLLGGYGYTQSGELRYDSGLSVSDLEMFQPLFARWQASFRKIDGSYVSRGNALGRFFSPLIRLDRRFVHRTRLVPFLDGSEMLETHSLAGTYRDAHGSICPMNRGKWETAPRASGS
ncbi:MAG: hypothetical protein JW889_09685 [Verrucomicrobia bacterium]|nr:hypothetical protein [Verrucomicrobiota bacterium]